MSECLASSAITPLIKEEVTVEKSDMFGASERAERSSTVIPVSTNLPISTPLSPEHRPKSEPNDTILGETTFLDSGIPSSVIYRAKNFKECINIDTSSKKTLDEQEEWELLQKLEHSRKPLTAKALRLKRKLHLRRLKRGLDISIFDIDKTINDYLRSQVRVEGVKKTVRPKRGGQAEKSDKDEGMITDQKIMQLQKYTCTQHRHSFARRLYGHPDLSNTLTSFQTWTSPYFGRKLRPYIRRDYESKPPKLQLLENIVGYSKRLDPTWNPPPSAPIDYCYFQPQHLQQVNDCLCRCFWPGIDMSEALLFPDFSIVALYKRMVIGCAFMTADAYITYIAVDQGWEGSGIGQFMLYHLIQTSIGKDVTLHVFANNPAMILYQKFGFKPEQFFVNFYDKYLPEGSRLCKNAFFMRLRR
ncbi:hypothetical protein K7432_007869 [Basidiobolus ranarum]|uniref:N-acetyltransferase domain-containing protein n=1 Tax=Basidiobolus ranarum TaxID=34480 RepID=A0ABR2WSW0_9FUNG